MTLLLQLSQFNLGIRLTLKQFQCIIFKREITIIRTWKPVLLSWPCACKGLCRHITMHWQLSFLLKLRIYNIWFVHCRCLARDFIHPNLWKWLLLLYFEWSLWNESGVFVKYMSALLGVNRWRLRVDNILLQDTSTLLSRSHMCRGAIENLMLLSGRFVLNIYLFRYS